MQIPQKIFSPLGTSLYFHANPSKKKSFVLSSNMVALSCVYKKCCGYMPSCRKGWQDSWSYNTFSRGIWKGNISARNCWRISVVVFYSLDKFLLWTQNQVDWEGMTWKNFSPRGSHVYPWIFFNFNRLFLNLLLSASSIHDAFSVCNSLQFNFFRRTHQSGHHEAPGGAPVVVDTRIQMHGNQKFAQSVVVKLGESMSRNRRSWN